jgi:hypothetical protein
MTLSRDNYRVLCGGWAIRELPPGDLRLADKYGLTSWDECTIYIDGGLSWEMRVEVLIHETIHIIVGGRESCDLTKEDDVRTFSEILVDTLLRNSILTKG